MQRLNAVPVPRVRMAVRKATILFPDVLDTHVYRTRKRSPTIAAIRPMASNTLVDSNQSETKTKEPNSIICVLRVYVWNPVCNYVRIIRGGGQMEDTDFGIVFQINTRVCQKKIMGFIFDLSKLSPAISEARHLWNVI